MCSISYIFLPQNVFTSPSFLVVQVSQMWLYQVWTIKTSAHFMQINTHQRAMIGIGDYTLITFDYIMYWQNLTDYSLRDQNLTNPEIAPNKHICKGDYRTSILIHMKHRQNTRMKIIQRRYKMHNYTPRMSNIGPYEACNLNIDSLGNTHPLKVDKILQWMSHHPTNPTYSPVLSGTMTHSSGWCLNSTTRTHNTNTYTQKVCIRYLTYCMPTLWKWFMTCNT